MVAVARIAGSHPCVTIECIKMVKHAGQDKDWNALEAERKCFQKSVSDGVERRVKWTSIDILRTLIVSDTDSRSLNLSHACSHGGSIPTEKLLGGFFGRAADPGAHLAVRLQTLTKHQVAQLKYVIGG